MRAKQHFPGEHSVSSGRNFVSEESASKITPQEYRMDDERIPPREKLAKIGEQPAFYDSYSEEQQENGPFNQGNRFFESGRAEITGQPVIKGKQNKV